MNVATVVLSIVEMAVWFVAMALWRQALLRRSVRGQKRGWRMLVSRRVQRVDFTPDGWKYCVRSGWAAAVFVALGIILAILDRTS